MHSGLSGYSLLSPIQVAQASIDQNNQPHTPPVWGRRSPLCDQLIASGSNRPAFPAPKSIQFPLSPRPGEGRMPRHPPRLPPPTVYTHPRGSARLGEHILHVHTPRLPALPLSHCGPQMTIIPQPLFAEVNNLLSDWGGGDGHRFAII